MWPVVYSPVSFIVTRVHGMCLMNNRVLLHVAVSVWYFGLVFAQSTLYLIVSASNFTVQLLCLSFEKIFLRCSFLTDMLLY